jgi:ABC-type sugar transport system ATPase subunit
MNVYDNKSYGMKERGVPRALRDAEIRRVASLPQLDALPERRPSQLSGGGRQRVAMGRVLVRSVAGQRLRLQIEPARALIFDPGSERLVS